MSMMKLSVNRWMCRVKKKLLEDLNFSLDQISSWNILFLLPFITVLVILLHIPITKDPWNYSVMNCLTGCHLTQISCKSLNITSNVVIHGLFCPQEVLNTLVVFKTWQYFEPRVLHGHNKLVNNSFWHSGPVRCDLHSLRWLYPDSGRQEFISAW